MSTEPSIAKLQEHLDTQFKEAVEKIAGRPFTDGSMDDLRLELESRKLKLIDMARERHHIDERVYSRACYELVHYRQVAQYLTKVCAENGFDFSLTALMPSVVTLHIHGAGGGPYDGSAEPPPGDGPVGHAGTAEVVPGQNGSVGGPGGVGVAPATEDHSEPVICNTARSTADRGPG